jgi:hypothetical protein
LLTNGCCGRRSTSLHPEAARSQVTSQLAKPASMMSITTAEKSVRIPTFSLGIEWSEQATKYVNLDLMFWPSPAKWPLSAMLAPMSTCCPCMLVIPT